MGAFIPTFTTRAVQKPGFSTAVIYFEKGMSQQYKNIESHSAKYVPYTQKLHG
jgi:hypothetical protein